MNSITDLQTLRIGHSPDPDDAFMWYALANATTHVEGVDAAVADGPKVDTGPYRFVHVLEDIQALNQRAQQADLEITAISIHQYPWVAKDYALTSCGASMGDHYGPMVVTHDRSAIHSIHELFAKRATIAIPGRQTSAYLALMLLAHEYGGADAVQGLDCHVVMFDQIIPAVAAGRFDAGLIIHEGQLTYAQASLRCLVDLGQWWTQSRGLPLPLGGNAIRRDLDSAMGPICSILLRSIQYALDHRQQAIAYALKFARDMGVDLADRFVGMYVNDWTLDYGPKGQQAIQQFLDEGAAIGVVPSCDSIDFIHPA